MLVAPYSSVYWKIEGVETLYVWNKADEVAPPMALNHDVSRGTDQNPYLISAKTGEGVDDVMVPKKIYQLIEYLKSIQKK